MTDIDRPSMDRKRKAYIVMTTYGRQAINDLNRHNTRQDRSIKSITDNTASHKRTHSYHLSQSSGDLSNRRSILVKRSSISNSNKASSSHIKPDEPVFPLITPHKDRIESRMVKGFFMKKPKVDKTEIEQAAKLLKFKEELWRGNRVIDSHILNYQHQKERISNVLRERMETKYMEDGWDNISVLRHKRTSVYKALFASKSRKSQSIG